MKPKVLLFVWALLLISCNEKGPAESSEGNSPAPAKIDRNADIAAIKQSIVNYDQGWDAKDLEKVLAEYSQDIDWTNAFGDRTQGKGELRELLGIIFNLDFVMTGENNYQDPDINFLTEDYAIVRSKNIRTGQKWPDGSDMNDRIINHLRVFQRIDGKWLCINHMISQAHEKQRPNS